LPSPTTILQGPVYHTVAIDQVPPPPAMILGLHWALECQENPSFPQRDTLVHTDDNNGLCHSEQFILQGLLFLIPDLILGFIFTLSKCPK
jgi:hypothetical protein